MNEPETSRCARCRRKQGGFLARDEAVSVFWVSFADSSGRSEEPVSGELTKSSVIISGSMAWGRSHGTSRKGKDEATKLRIVADHFERCYRADLDELSWSLTGCRDERLGWERAREATEPREPSNRLGCLASSADFQGLCQSEGLSPGPNTCGRCRKFRAISLSQLIESAIKFANHYSAMPLSRLLLPCCLVSSSPQRHGADQSAFSVIEPFLPDRYPLRH
jgi:hypothetical protein